MPSWHIQPSSNIFLLDLLVNMPNFNYDVHIFDMMLPYTPLGWHGCRPRPPFGASAETQTKKEI